jgi:CRISPR-associated protein Cas5t
MRVLKIELEGITTSFRYPFFVLGRQPTYAMPPPATIYGHICSVVGDIVDPRGLAFAYWFAHDGIAVDLEHAHMVGLATGTMPQTGVIGNLPKAIHGGIEPLRREFFYHPRLTLYLNRPDLEDAFRSPRYPVVLGRSQDLATYTSVECIELRRAPRAYYENTLLPVTMQTAPLRGIGVTMPRFLNLKRNRTPHFAQYIVLLGVLRPDEAKGLADIDGHWTDLDTPMIDGAHRGVLFLSFVDEDLTQWL